MGRLTGCPCPCPRCPPRNRSWPRVLRRKSWWPRPGARRCTWNGSASATTFSISEVLPWRLWKRLRHWSGPPACACVPWKWPAKRWRKSRRFIESAPGLPPDSPAPSRRGSPPDSPRASALAECGRRSGTSPAPLGANGNVQSLFFGPPDKQLFGVYYQPQRQPARDCGVVLCNPLAPELGHTCKCFHHLALLLAQAGFAAFRFDYFGTGDSAGSGEEGSVRQWMEDIRCATDELRRQGCRRFCLAGLRFGATLAARFATERDAVDSLVLWEPWVSGQDCLADLQRLHELAFTAAGFGCPRTEEEMLGQPFPNRLREEIP